MHESETETLTDHDCFEASQLKAHQLVAVLNEQILGVIVRVDFQTERCTSDNVHCIGSTIAESQQLTVIISDRPTLNKYKVYHVCRT